MNIYKYNYRMQDFNMCYNCNHANHGCDEEYGEYIMCDLIGLECRESCICDKYERVIDERSNNKTLFN